jgi:tRNA uracil 4-sulfurtransferase
VNDTGTEPEALFLIRLSAELSTKARGTRRRFTRQLMENIRDGFHSAGGRAHVEDQWTRLFVRTKTPAAAEALARIPGISSFSLVEGRCPGELAEIVEAGTALYADRVRGRRYAVKVRRAGEHDFSSSDLLVQLGSALNADATVDLDDPEVLIEVEIRDDRAYLFSERTSGLGGLPLGVEGRAICLLSGGFDSAVAAWLMLKRGVQLDYVFCNLAGGAYERSVVTVGKILAEQWSYGTRPRLFVVDFTLPLAELRATTQPRYWQLILKRLMYRAAIQIADEVEASAIVTGEAIGQVSSQTLANLAALDDASDRPILRPLLGFDKMEIIELAKRVGTAAISSKVKEYCAIAPGNPVTNAGRDATAVEERRMDLQILGDAVTNRHVVDLCAVNAADLVQAYLFTDVIPDDALVLDVRSDEEWDRWHYPGSEHFDFWDLSGQLSRLDRNRVYVVLCDGNVQSAQIAEQMQMKGMEAYAFRGGTRALRAFAGRTVEG